MSLTWLLMLREFFSLTLGDHTEGSALFDQVCVSLFSTKVPPNGNYFKDRLDLFHIQLLPEALEMFTLMLKLITKDAKHFSGETENVENGECFLLQESLSRYAYALRFIGILLPSAQKLHYEQQLRQNALCLCPRQAHKRTLNWVIQWQVCKDVTGVLEQGDALALQKSALWVNNAPCYQFGHAAKVNVKTHWSTHSSAFAAAYQAPARRQVSFLHGNNHKSGAADGDKYADMCDKQAVSMAGSCSSRVMAKLEEEKQVNRLRDKEARKNLLSKNWKTNSSFGSHSTCIFCFPVMKRSCDLWFATKMQQ